MFSAPAAGDITVIGSGAGVTTADVNAIAQHDFAQGMMVQSQQVSGTISSIGSGVVGALNGVIATIDANRSHYFTKADTQALQAKVERLVYFTPSGAAKVPATFAQALAKKHGGKLDAYQRFMQARWHDFEQTLAQHGLHPNDLSTARSLDIAVAYRLYDGSALKDATNGTILRNLVAIETAAPQWDHPWSDTRKQDLYERIGLQASLFNYLYDDAKKRNDGARLASLRAQARTVLQQQLGRDPSGVGLNTFACAVYPRYDCPTLMRRLRAAFGTSG